MMDEGEWRRQRLELAPESGEGDGKGGGSDG